MANFQTHIAVSSVAGAVYGTAGHLYADMPVETAIIAGGLCSVSGMLPDLDSDNSVPVREMLSFGAAALPMFLLDRLQLIEFSHEELVIIAAGMYCFIRFAVGSFLKRCTVHRGMFHSVPALVIAFLLAYLVCHSGDVGMRVFKASGVAIGFLSHLVLDEIWAVRWTALGPRTKRSFGTAIKFFGDSGAANSLAYGLLLVIGLAAYQDLSQPTRRPIVAEKPRRPLVERLADAFAQKNAIEQTAHETAGQQLR